MAGKPVLLGAIALYGIANLTCALSNSIEMLIAARFAACELCRQNLRQRVQCRCTRRL